MFESHFQSFDDTADPSQGAPRIAALRAALRRLGLDGFLVPRADRQQNEYVPPAEERLAWLMGFTGSAGLGLVLKNRAVLFVDGRYTLQVRDQVDLALITPVSIATTSPEKWLEQNLKSGWKIGYDPWLHTPAQIERFEKAAALAGASLVPVAENPIDGIWRDRPPPPCGKVSLHPLRFAGVGTKDKLARIVKALGSADALLVSDPHAVAWTFNIRGKDVAHTPLPLAFVLIPRKGRPTLYIEAQKLDAETRGALEALAMIEDPKKLEADVAEHGRAKTRVLFDSATAPVKLVTALKDAGGTADVGTDPIALMKAAKNRTELAGARKAQLRDAVAMVNFLQWFEAEAPKGKLTEIDAAKALETFRCASRKLKDVSFPTISAAGLNSAIPHYRVTKSSSRRIGKGIFLIDSGGQYEDGTTDITRTIAVGRPTAEMRDRFTRVLKGNIAISRALFPKGTSGAQLDSFARKPLWDAGLDFDHGTGHGVGSYLSVHEGPQRIAKLGATALEPGMILSNEPGYYKEGCFGIRIENLVVVEERQIEGAERPMLGFETITLVPIDTRLIEPKLMSEDEIKWFNAYHARVRAALLPHVKGDVQKWLRSTTKAIRR
jgi:Xaa-Pro aminopeptidase